MSANSESEQDYLENLTVDLVIGKQYHPILEHLLRTDKGEWTLLADLGYEVQPDVPRHELADELFATWLDYPYSPSGDYCLLIFFQESLIWSKAFIFRRASIIKTNE